MSVLQWVLAMTPVWLFLGFLGYLIFMRADSYIGNITRAERRSYRWKILAGPLLFIVASACAVQDYVEHRRDLAAKLGKRDEDVVVKKRERSSAGRFHFHSVWNNDDDGFYQYQTCRCGARRTAFETNKIGMGSYKRGDWPPAMSGWESREDAEIRAATHKRLTELVEMETEPTEVPNEKDLW